MGADAAYLIVHGNLSVRDGATTSGQEGGVDVIISLLRRSAQFLRRKKLVQTRWQKVFADTLLFALLGISSVRWEV